MKGLLRTAAVVVALAGSPAWSQTGTTPAEPEQQSSIEQMIVEGLTKALNMISFAWGTVVPYALPEVLPNGDIIIRRKPPQTAPTDEPSETFTRTPGDTGENPDFI